MAKLADLTRIQRLWNKIKNTFHKKGDPLTLKNALNEQVGLSLDGEGYLVLTDGDNIIQMNTRESGTVALTKDITNAVANLATKTEVETAVANAGHLKREKVTTLPGVSTASENVIYMVPATDGSGNDVFDEYMKIDGKLEKIGSNRVDLSGYSTTEQMNTAISTAVSNSYTLITNDDIDSLT